MYIFYSNSIDLRALDALLPRTVGGLQKVIGVQPDAHWSAG